MKKENNSTTAPFVLCVEPAATATATTVAHTSISKINRKDVNTLLLFNRTPISLVRDTGTGLVESGCAKQATIQIKYQSLLAHSLGLPLFAVSVLQINTVHNRRCSYLRFTWFSI